MVSTKTQLFRRKASILKFDFVLLKMYALYRQTDAATSVSFSAVGRFMGKNVSAPGVASSGASDESDLQLVTIGGTNLRIFRLNPYVLEQKVRAGDEDDDDDTVVNWEQTTKLECLLSFRLLAPVQSIAVARTPATSDADCLLLAFEEAKLSIVAYDRPNHSLKTLSLHAYEEEVLRGGFTRDHSLPIVRADPESRCAAVLVYGRHVAIVPLMTRVGGAMFDDDEGTNDNNNKAASKGPGQSANIFSYTVPLENFDPRLQNVADIGFLHGYHEPTLLFLYEPQQTTAGKAAIRYDSFCLLGVSLNVKDRMHAVVWQVSNLPMTCLNLTPVCKPTCGTVVVGTNEIIYLNQSVPPFGLGTNCCGEGFTQFPLKNEQHLRVAWDHSAVDFISPTEMLAVSKEGRLFFVTLVVDPTNASVKALHVLENSELISSSPRTLTNMGAGLVFVGSRLGDSQLLQCMQSALVRVETATTTAAGHNDRHEVEPALYNSESSKRARIGMQDDAMEDLALYGEVFNVAEPEDAHVVQYSVQLLDALVNVGPLKTVAVGSPPPVAEPLRTAGNLDPIFDLVCAAGHGKDGAVVAFQRTVRPNILTGSEIAGAMDMWTVGRREDNSNQFLLVTKELSTLVLGLEEEIIELETSGFLMSQRTVAAGDMDHGRLIVQVTSMCVVLLKGSGESIQVVELATNFPVARASICDPYVCVLTESGEIIFLQLAPSGVDASLQLIVSRPPVQHTPTTAVCLYRDFSGLFVYSSGGSPSAALVGHKTNRSKGAAPGAADAVGGDKPSGAGAGTTAVGNTDEDDDLLLYGEITADTSISGKRPSAATAVNGDFPMDAMPAATQASVQQQGSFLHNPNTVEPTWWAVLGRDNGQLEMFSLPDWNLVYVVRKMNMCFNILYDTDPNTMTMEEQQATKQDEENLHVIREIALCGLGINQARPILMAVVDENVLVYEVFPFDTGLEDHLAIRFKRQPLTLVARNQRLTSGATGKLRVDLRPTEELDRCPPVLRQFDGIGAYGAGVFVAGPYPCWVLMASGQLRAHPMTADGAVRAFTPFNNGLCPQGFLYLADRNEEMRICQLSSDINYQLSYPCRKVRLERTVHFVFYMLQSNVYVVVSSESKPNQKMCVIIGDEKTFETHEKDPNFIYPTLEWFTLQLFSPDTWLPIPNVGDIEFEEFEVCTDSKEILLKSEGTVSGFQNYLVCSTTWNYGEEVNVRGRLMISEIIDVVPDPEHPETRHKIKTVYDKEQKGPVTSICGCQGYLMTGMGQKVYIWTLRDNDLQGISFLDYNYYICKLVGMRNLCLAADLYKSVSLLRYQENCKALSLASRDFRPSNYLPVPMTTEFMVDNRQLAIFMSDENANISMLTYQPEAKESFGGQKLILRGEIFTGERIADVVRVRGHVTDGVVENKPQSVSRHACMFGTLEGGFGYILPLPEKVYRRLHMLQNCLTSHVLHVGGLNPKAARIAKGQNKRAGAGSLTQQTSRTIVDGDLVFEYMHLSTPDKLEIAKRLGTSKQQLIDDLIELDRVCTHF